MSREPIFSIAPYQGRYLVIRHDRFNTEVVAACEGEGYAADVANALRAQEARSREAMEERLAARASGG